jgi:hypothetical protein
MGKNKRSKIVYNGLELDSTEELQFIYWLDEAKEAGLIEYYRYQPVVYNLFEDVIGKNVKGKELIIVKAHIYTPDFAVKFTDKFYKMYIPMNWFKVFKNIDIKPNEMIIDIKGTFSRNGGDRVFSINQKWVYQKYGIYIHKIIPFNLFKLTWCPKLAKLTPKKQLIVEKYKNLLEIKDILKGNY